MHINSKVLPEAIRSPDNRSVFSQGSKT